MDSFEFLKMSLGEEKASSPGSIHVQPDAVNVADVCDGRERVEGTQHSGAGGCYHSYWDITWCKTITVIRLRLN